MAADHPTDPVVAKRRMERFVSDHTRVITRLFRPGDQGRVRRIVQRILSLDPARAAAMLEEVMRDFGQRHRHIENVFLDHFVRIRNYLANQGPLKPPAADELIATLNDLPHERRLLVGAYFTLEYSVESAAFFNPSMVPHPDQSGATPGGVRFILSFRAVGEGHISSVVFRTGLIDADNRISFDPVSRYVETPEVVKDPSYDRRLFMLKLKEMGYYNFITGAVVGGLPPHFSYLQLMRAIAAAQQEYPELTEHETLRTIQWLADSNYQLRFDPQQPISECVLFPVSQNERHGIEDARFVRFAGDDGQITYYATYTAFNGLTMLPQMIETTDFHNFRVLTLNGRAVQNKGMALFPRKVGGKYMMVSRMDGENLFLAQSDDVHFWHDVKPLQEPAEGWELTQIGNSGSPLETPEGWLLLTHGVGPMRRYSIGAMLLDLNEPCKVIGRLRQPLLTPGEIEREGYVPNVVYTCGAMIHNGELVLPYAMSDTASGIATVDVKDLVDRLKAEGP